MQLLKEDFVLCKNISIIGRLEMILETQNSLTLVDIKIQTKHVFQPYITYSMA